MKTAISLPDKLFADLEAEARELGTTRSQLYRQVLERHLLERQGQAVTDKLNEFYSQEGVSNSLDPVLQRLQAHALSKERW